MSLSVHVYLRDPMTGQMNLIEPTNHSEELAGFERCRHNLWGSQAVINLGLTLLPLLAQQDIYAMESDLPRLEREAQAVLQSAEALAQATGYSTEFITYRANKILAAPRRAMATEGAGVVIW